MIDLANEAKTPLVKMSLQEELFLERCLEAGARIQMYWYDTENWSSSSQTEMHDNPNRAFRVHPNDVNSTILELAGLDPSSLSCSIPLVRLEGKPTIPEYQTADLRDQFAMAAMQALITANYFRDIPEPSEQQQYYADFAYAQADAMLKARGGDNE